ncbi:Aspartic protease 2 [Aphelenchoides fujianensis]|nr:Aspartic protease 2 [Aphelenchoides fujianensis]
MTALFRLLHVATIVHVAFSSVFRAPMIKKDTLQAKLLREKRLHEFRKANRVSLAKFAKGGVHRFDEGRAPFYDYGNTEYPLQIGVGTPPQIFEVIPDTGTSTVWIVDNTCDPNNSYYDCPIFCKESPLLCSQLCEDFCCPSNVTTPAPGNKRLFDHGDPCANKPQFDYTASSTYQQVSKTFNGSTELGDVSGYLGQDTFTIGELEIPYVIFGQADRLSVSFTNASVQGVLGLGFSDANFDNQSSVLQNAVDLDVLDNNMFTIWLQSEDGVPVDQPAGALTLGGFDFDHCPVDYTYVPRTSDSMFMINTVGFGTDVVKSSANYNTLVTIGASQIIVPRQVMLELTTATNAEFDWDYGLYEVDCSLRFLWSVWVKDGDDELRVNQSTLLLPSPDGRCFLDFVYFDEFLGDVDIVLGTPFLRQFCTVYYRVSITRLGFGKPLF